MAISFTLFETTESVIQVLWDVALAFFIVRLAFIYFLLNFVSGLYVSYLLAFMQQLATVPPLPPLQQSEHYFSFWILLKPFFMFLLSALWARYLVTAYEVPRASSFRLAIGGIASLFMVLAEMLLLLLVGGGGGSGSYSSTQWWWIVPLLETETDPKAGLAFVIILLAYAFMPTAIMVFESRNMDMDMDMDIGMDNDNKKLAKTKTKTQHGHEKKNIADAV